MMHSLTHVHVGEARQADAREQQQQPGGKGQVGGGLVPGEVFAQGPKSGAVLGEDGIKKIVQKQTLHRVWQAPLAIFKALQGAQHAGVGQPGLAAAGYEEAA
jgi:hypothetical protein